MGFLFLVVLSFLLPFLVGWPGEVGSSNSNLLEIGLTLSLLSVGS